MCSCTDDTICVVISSSPGTISAEDLLYSSELQFITRSLKGVNHVLAINRPVPIPLRHDMGYNGPLMLYLIHLFGIVLMGNFLENN